MFSGRKKELEFLAQQYAKSGFKFVPVYGRRRIGKTALVKEFAKNKNAIYFLARETSIKENAALFCALIYEKYEVRLKDDFGSALEFLSKQENLLIIIDELPNLIKEDKSFTSHLQELFDGAFSVTNNMAIVLGSSVRMMYDEVLSYKSPLYGRRVGQIKLECLGIMDEQEISKLDFEDAVKRNMITGGIPYYTNSIEEKSPVDWSKLALNQYHIFYEEGFLLLKQEFVDIVPYYSILQAISSGATTSGEIASKAGFKDNVTISPYLKRLELAGYVKRELPAMGGKKGVYQISDNYLSYFFAVIEPLRPSPSMDKFNGLMHKFCCSQFEQFVRQNCRYFIPFEIESCARQWGIAKSADLGKNEYEIDILAQNKKTNEIFLGECKWEDNVDGQAIEAELIKKAEFVNWEPAKTQGYFAIFAKSFKRLPKTAKAYDLRTIEKALKIG